MISATGWLIGGTALMTTMISIVIGIFFIYKAKKLDARLLIYAGLLIICTGLFYLGGSVTFLWLFFSGRNIPNESGIHGLLSFTSVAPGIICAIYLGSELLAPNKKKILVGIYTIVGLIFEIFLYACPRCSLNFVNENSTTEVIDSNFIITYPTFIIVVFSLISVSIFCGIGFLIKAQQSTGEIKKKFRFLSIGFIIFIICAAFDSLLAPGIWLIPVRIGMFTYALLIYFGLKPAKTI